ncbi:portal protein [Vibrio phage D164]
MVMTEDRFYRLKSEAKLENIKGRGFGDNFGINLISQGRDTIAPATALAIEAVYTCVRDKAETVGRLPVILYNNENPEAVERVNSGRLLRIFTQQPNDFMTMQMFMEFMAASYELYGAFYAYKRMNDRNNIMELIPFRHQQNVRPQMDVAGRVFYTYTTNDGRPMQTFNLEDLFIVSQFSLNGFTPISPIQWNAMLLNGTDATEKTWKSLQENGITSQFALKTDKSINDEAVVRLKSDWKGFRGAPGVDNIPILEDGLDVRSLQLSPKDAELLGSREFSVNRICRIFRVPTERIGMPRSGSQNQTFLDIDEFYMRNGIEPILVKYENAVNIMLRGLGVRRFVRVNRKAFYNGSPAKMVEAVSNEIKMGLATVNEARHDLGRDPVEGGDVFAIDTNNLTFGRWDQLHSLQNRDENRITEGAENGE